MKGNTVRKSKRQRVREAKARADQKLELRKLLSGSRGFKHNYAQIDPNSLVKVTLHNGDSFWDHPLATNDTAYEFHKAGVIPREQVKSLFFWRKPADKDAFLKAIQQNDRPQFSTADWMKELGGK